jgi:hypothetical protein
MTLVSNSRRMLAAGTSRGRTAFAYTGVVHQDLDAPGKSFLAISVVGDIELLYLKVHSAFGSLPLQRLDLGPDLYRGVPGLKLPVGARPASELMGGVLVGSWAQ